MLMLIPTLKDTCVAVPILMLAFIAVPGVFAIRYFGGRDAELDCSRPQGTSLNENPRWILNDSFILNTSNSQKYEVDNRVPRLTVKNLSYEDAGRYSCDYSEGDNTQADTLVIIGEPVFSCGRSVCQLPAVCIVKEYATLTFDLQFTFQTLGMVVGEGSPPFQFMLRRSASQGQSSYQVLGYCNYASGKCLPASTELATFTGVLGSNLTATINQSHLEGGEYSVQGVYRNEVIGNDITFSQSVQVSVRSCGSLDSDLVNVSVNECEVSYSCPGDSQRRTAQCLEPDEWNGLDCPTPAGPTQMDTMPPTPTQMNTMPPTTSSSSSLLVPMAPPASSNTAAVVVAVVLAVTMLIAAILVGVSVATVICWRQRRSTLMSPAVHLEGYHVSNAGDGRPTLNNGKRPESVVSVPEKDFTLPDIDEATGMSISHSQIFNM